MTVGREGRELVEKASRERVVGVLEGTRWVGGVSDVWAEKGGEV